MEQWLRHLHPKAALSVALLLLLFAHLSCSAQPLAQVLAQADEQSTSISTLSATIIYTNSMGRTFETRIEFKWPGLFRTEFFPSGKNYPITVTQLTETALWKTFPRGGSTTRNDTPSLLPWVNEAITFLAIFLSPSHALGSAQFVTAESTIEDDSSFVIRTPEFPNESVSAPQERPKQITCWIDRADFTLQKIKVSTARLRGARQLVAEEWTEVAPGLFLPSVFKSSTVDIPELQAKKLCTLGLDSPAQNTAMYHLKDIRINEPIADARFHPLLDETVLVADVKPQSAEEYKKRINSEPDNADLYFNLGKVYLSSGSNLADTEEALNKTIARPRAKAGYAALGRLYGMVKKDRESAELLEKYVALFPDDPDLHRALSRQYERQLKFDRAIEELNLKIAIESDPVIDEYNMAELLYKSGDFDGAVRLYRWILDNDLPHPEIWAQG